MKDKFKMSLTVCYFLLYFVTPLSCADIFSFASPVSLVSFGSPVFPAVFHPVYFASCLPHVCLSPQFSSVSCCTPMLYILYVSLLIFVLFCSNSCEFVIYRTRKLWILHLGPPNIPWHEQAQSRDIFFNWSFCMFFFFFLFKVFSISNTRYMAIDMYYLKKEQLFK